MQALDAPRADALHPCAPALLEILVHPHLQLPLQHRVRVRVARPRKRAPVAEGLVPPRERGVVDVLAVPDDGDEPAVGRVRDRRGEDFG